MVSPMKEQWEREAEIAYRTPAYEKDFEIYWRVTAALRQHMDVDTLKACKEIKEAVFERQKE